MNNEIKGPDIPDLNIFMMCEKLNEDAIREIPEGYRRRKAYLWTSEQGRRIQIEVRPRKDRRVGIIGILPCEHVHNG